MASRHLLRSIAMQTLYEWDFCDYDNKRIEEILNRNIEEFAADLEDRDLAKKLVFGIRDKRRELDKIIEKTAPEWPLEQISRVDRNVLRLGLYELLFGNYQEVPPKVAINEAIELAKTFGSESAGKFINGVLGTVYREIGEPGKFDDNKDRIKQIKNLEKLPIEKLAGAVVFRKEGEETFLALVHDVFGYWTLSKGHIENGENAEAGASREVGKELGIKNIEILEEIATNEYAASDPEKGLVRRQVVYFLARTAEKEFHLPPKEGLDDAKWFKSEELEKIKIYKDIREIINKAVEKINKI